MLLGSNLGDRLAYLQGAQNSLTETVGKLLQKSAVYETAAWGLEDQAAFLNQVLQISTELSPIDLLTQINLIEKELGRVREIKWGTRVIDIDILYFDDIILETEKLIIPHPALQNRRFTLIPLTEIAPAYIHPRLNKSNEALLADCPDTLEVSIYKK